MTKRKPSLSLVPSEADSSARFLKLAGHLRVHGKPIAPLPSCVTPEAEALRQQKAAAQKAQDASAEATRGGSAL